MTSVFCHEALFSFNLYPCHGFQGCKDQRHQMALPCLWVGLILGPTAFLKIRTTDTTPRALVWSQFPQSHTNAGDQDMFSNVIVLFLIFLWLLILSGYIL